MDIKINFLNMYLPLPPLCLCWKFLSKHRILINKEHNIILYKNVHSDVNDDIIKQHLATLKIHTL